MPNDDNIEPAEKKPRRSILELSSEEARAFFLKHESYVSLDLPPYFDFSPLLEKLSSELPDDPNAIRTKRNAPRDYANLNHEILANKDGHLAWRSLKLIHPVLYVQFVHLLTKPENWKKTTSRIKSMARNKRIHCLSMPVESLSDESDKAEQVAHWWQEVEQRSIELSLEYQYLAYSDISDCYGQIYTHSLAWALNSKRTAKDIKKRKDLKLIGNAVDSLLQDLNHGQTNGIPQGSVLSDFIAEILLAYADLIIGIEIKKSQIFDYQILRYRDDYRIFTKEPLEGEKILQIVSRVLQTLGLKLNPGKTGSSSSVISSSIKTEKIDWLNQSKSNKNLQKHLLIIHGFAQDHPNKGIINTLLIDYLKRLAKMEESPSGVMQLIAITVDIGVHNPVTHPNCAAILSSLLQWIPEDAMWTVFQKVNKRFRELPNNGYMQIWLQRFSIYFDKLDNIFDFVDSPECVEKLCQKVRGQGAELWNNDWIRAAKIKKIVKETPILDKEILDSLDPVISSKEVTLFTQKY